MAEPAARSGPRSILVLGATGTIGRAVVRAAVARGDSVVAFARRGSDTSALSGATVRIGETTAASLDRDILVGERFDAVVSCLASRTGVPRDAWAVDHEANLAALSAAQRAGAAHFVLLSAICVQRPRLAFQHAKLAFEAALMASGMRWTIVRPTAFFKSLSGQVERVRRGKPFLLFGDGRLTACTPVADDDLAAFIVACLDDPAAWNRILPIGGPGPAMTPREQGEALFTLLERKPKFRSVPVGLLDTIIGGLALIGRVAPTLRDKAELARIGRYYATESMLVLGTDGRYDAAATPATGAQTLVAHYVRLLSGEAADDRGDHAVF